ncbi:branched-chain-amino-acid aminotransferase [Favolaschia claudopus]|uniref:Branched-chain-amino-acid aminotransferase n=1 Tax=Favolaschia claudopus TaxID=2862362 RepID=A0AAV9ZVH7_9AGAR
MASAVRPNGNATQNGHVPNVVAPLDASRLKIERATTLKPIPAPGSYSFGDIHTDHMLVCKYHPSTGWSAPEIKPYGPLAIDPSSNCLQYASNVFEGMKAVLNPEGKPCMFRPRDNMKRLLTSAKRMALPAFDPEALLTCISTLVTLESRWIPSLPDHRNSSLYIRPTMVGTKASIKVGASDEALLYAIVTPVGPYFPVQKIGGVSLLAVSEHVRSWPGGTGGFKLGLNYSPGFVPQQAAAALGYDQVLWLLDEDKKITEAGAMNFFAVAERDDGGITIVTPPTDGTILPGITRDATLVLLREHAKNPSANLLNVPFPPNVQIEERPLTVNELAAWAAKGQLLECFGTGTAVLVVAIDRIGDFDVSDDFEDTGSAVSEIKEKKRKMREITLKGGLVGLGPVGKALWDKLLALKEGREQYMGWNVLCE